MTDLIAAKRRDPGDSLLDRLIAARDGDDRLSEEELVSLAVLLLVAGHETTTNFLGNAVLALLAAPADAGTASGRTRTTSLPRWTSCSGSTPPSARPLSGSPRRPSRSGGTEIPAGAPVLVALGAANRDPERFPAPDRLDLDRDAAGHLGFGHGIHRCVGAPLAKAEAEIALRAVLTRFPAIRLAVPPDQLTWRHTRLVRGLTSLPVLA